MLETKLAEASRQASIKRIRFAVALAAGALLAGLFLSGVIRLDLAMFGIGSENAGIEKPEKTQQADTVQKPEMPKPAVTTEPAAEQLSGRQLEEKRDAFKQALMAYDSEIRPVVETPGFSAWNPAARDEILSARNDAIQAFSAGKYDPALSKLEQAALLAAKEIGALEAAYDTAIKRAMDALGADQYEAASIAIGDALRIKPEAPDALDLKARIDKLPEVLSLVDKAVTARVENDLEAEAKLLQRILELDPARKDLKQRYGDVTATLNEQRFNRYISDGMAHVDQRQLAPAESNLNKAKSLFKSRSEVKLLEDRVALLKQELNAADLIAKAIKASSEDDYVRAAKMFAEAGKILPDNKDAGDGLKLAKVILDMKAEISRHVATPERLSSPPVEKSVRQLLNEAATVAPFSPSLSAEIVQLSQLLDTYTKPVDITVISDGLTSVSVRGVGVVGETKQRVIQLRPGKYNFEGKRLGYRSKLVPVEIPPGISTITVEIVCDEPV